MENLAPNPTKIATKWALIYVVTSIIITYGTDMLDLDPNSPVKYLTSLPFIAFCILAQKEYKDQLGGYLTFGQGFSTGFRYSLFAGALLALFSYLYIGFLNPGSLDKGIEQQQASMAEKGLSQEQIDAAMEMTKKYGALFAAIGAAVITLLIGCIIALIGAAILKKDRSPFDIEDNKSLDATV